VFLPLEALLGNGRVVTITITVTVTPQTLAKKKPIHSGDQNGYKTHQHVDVDHFEHCAANQ
jgi:hypothetical protein